MSSLIELIEQGDFLYLLFIAALLYYVGQMAVAHNPQSKKSGQGIFLLTLVVYALFEISRFGIYDAEGLLSILFRGLIAAGMMLGISWILLSASAFLFSPTEQATRSLQESRRKSQLEKDRKKQEREFEQQRQRDQKEWERKAPERERRQKKQQQAEQKCKADQHKREEIRLSCQLLYDQHTHELQQRFPRDRLVEYFDQYLSDSFPIEIVEQRGKLLKEMIESSLEQTAGNKQKFASLNEIAAYFQEQRKEIESLNYDEPTKQSFISSLNDQEDRTIREFLST